MQPQMVLTYSHDSHLLHRDIYRILCHAAETALHSSSDRERLAALWRDLIRVFFNIPAHYLYPSSVSTGPALPGQLVAGEAYSVNTKVITSYGSGVVLRYRERDDMYEIKLALGKAFLLSNVVFGAEQLSPQALFVSIAMICCI
jgi:hypothetical protein